MTRRRGGGGGFARGGGAGGRRCRWMGGGGQACCGRVRLRVRLLQPRARDSYRAVRRSRGRGRGRLDGERVVPSRSSALLRRAQAMGVRAAASGGDAQQPAQPAESSSEARQRAVEDLGEEWQTSGTGALGRRVRRFFALHGHSDGSVVAWQPEEGDDAALYRVVMDDGDVEDLFEEELEEGLEAFREARTVAQEVESILEAAWEALEMAVGLHSKPPSRPLGLAEAHERLGDAALQNEQPERAIEEYGEARRLLLELKEAGSLGSDDRRLADIEWFLGLTHLQLGHAAEAIAHYKQAMATLKLRRAGLQRAALDRQIVRPRTRCRTGWRWRR